MYSVQPLRVPYYLNGADILAVIKTAAVNLSKRANTPSIWLLNGTTVAGEVKHNSTVKSMCLTVKIRLKYFEKINFCG